MHISPFSYKQQCNQISSISKMEDVKSFMKDRKFGVTNLYPNFYRNTIDLNAALSPDEILAKNKRVAAEFLQLSRETQEPNRVRLSKSPIHVQKVCEDKNWLLFNKLLERSVQLEPSLHARSSQILSICDELFSGFKQHGPITKSGFWEELSHEIIQPLEDLARETEQSLKEAKPPKSHWNEEDIIEAIYETASSFIQQGLWKELPEGADTARSSVCFGIRQTSKIRLIVGFHRTLNKLHFSQEKMSLNNIKAMCSMCSLFGGNITPAYVNKKYVSQDIATERTFLQHI